MTDFTKVITFKILATIKNHYGSLESFKHECNSKSNLALARYNANFHVDSNILQALTRTNDGKRHLNEVLESLDSTLLVYKHKCDVKHKSGKLFSKPSTFYIPFAMLDKLFAMEDTDSSPFMTSSDFYTQQQHKLIDKYILGYRKERKTYTKSAKFLKAVENRKLNSIVAKDVDELTPDEMDELLEGII